ncbi:MAG: V4R domain-containing protein [Anaerolineales bacterium]
MSNVMADERTTPRSPGRLLPNTRLRQLLLAIEDVTRRSGLLFVLRQARMQRYATLLPEDNREPEITASEYAALLRVIERYYGRGARSTLLHIGRAMFRQLLLHRTLRRTVSKPFLALRSTLERQASALRWLADEWAYPTGRVIIETGGQRLALVDFESDGAFGRQTNAPMCWVTVGAVQEALHWATGREYDVTETECKAMGSAACHFEIDEHPL